MERRCFLSLTGAAALALSGCGGSGDAAGAPPVTVVTGPVAADWQALAKSLNGSLIQPRNADCAQAHLTFNSVYDGVLPQAVIQSLNATDVSQALAFVARFSLPVTARSRGGIAIFAQLQQVKTKYDPNGIFKFAQGISVVLHAIRYLKTRLFARGSVANSRDISVSLWFAPCHGQKSIVFISTR